MARTTGEDAVQGAPGEGWWLASDGKWYPPHLRPGPSPRPASEPPPAAVAPEARPAPAPEARPAPAQGAAVGPAPAPRPVVEAPRRSRLRVALLVLLAMAAIAGSFVLGVFVGGRDDGEGTEAPVGIPTGTVAATPAEVPGATPTAATEPSTPVEPRSEAAGLAECQTEKASVTTAIAAAEVANTMNDTPETPGDYLADDDRRYYTWGAAGSGFELQAIGTPPC